MTNPPDDQVELQKVVGIVRPETGHHLLQFLKVPENTPPSQAIVAIPFADLAEQMDMILPAGDGKDKVMRHLLDARNMAARVIFDQTN